MPGAWLACLQPGTLALLAMALTQPARVPHLRAAAIPACRTVPGRATLAAPFTGTMRVVPGNVARVSLAGLAPARALACALALPTAVPAPAAKARFAAPLAVPLNGLALAVATRLACSAALLCAPLLPLAMPTGKVTVLGVAAGVVMVVLVCMVVTPCYAP